jgi:hypothetical protein
MYIDANVWGPRGADPWRLVEYTISDVLMENLATSRHECAWLFDRVEYMYRDQNSHSSRLGVRVEPEPS